MTTPRLLFSSYTAPHDNAKIIILWLYGTTSQRQDYYSLVILHHITTPRLLFSGYTAPHDNANIIILWLYGTT